MNTRKRAPGNELRSWKVLAYCAIVVAIASLAFAAWTLLRPLPPRVATSAAGAHAPAPKAQPVAAPPFELSRARFADLPGWRQDDQSAALSAFLATCRSLARGGTDSGDAPDELLAVKGWSQVCRQARSLPGRSPEAVRRFFETSLEPWAVRDSEGFDGLFTGYYEPTLEGSRRHTDVFRYPLYIRPRDLVHVDLGRFRSKWRGHHISGRLRGKSLVPYFDRAAIERGALSGRSLELVWVNDPIDLFFLQVQGSGRILLPGGKMLRVGYAGENGLPYTSVGKELIAEGELLPAMVSLATLRGWFLSHPVRARLILDRNRSYVFFRQLSDKGPIGSAGVPLTPRRSLAVDRTYLPMGLPIWLATTVPDPEPGLADHPFDRLMVAQDTGGAIRGPIRGDVFWGPGKVAEAVAGRMKNRGRIWILLPRQGTVPAGLSAEVGEKGAVRPGR
ncbi:MAG TPA: MltA domain-containing protein [Thermoanaerobaculia bacterium]|nr:MltA domain-containing protein [Thermoanaerobaculia bacterium]